MGGCDGLWWYVVECGRMWLGDLGCSEVCWVMGNVVGCGSI
jgi:hypothetical protein